MRESVVNSAVSVWLVTVPDRHFAMNDYGSDGIFISTPEVCDDFATVQVHGKVFINAE